MQQSEEMMHLAYEALDEKKGIDVTVIDISGVTTIADYFVIAHGNNINQVQAMADEVQDRLGRAGFNCRNIEGYGNGIWILMDYGDLIVHVFNKEERRFYDLERIWRDGKFIDMSKS